MSLDNLGPYGWLLKEAERLFGAEAWATRTSHILRTDTPQPTSSLE
ncbi:hypothetical protein [Streptomyces agglomeratus]|nr:hypothetical protein [Streptomyces agglomeratus]